VAYCAPPSGGRNRGSLPSHLPRIETVVDIEDHSCPCCHGALHVIGEDRAERLDIRVLVIRRPKYACRACEDVVVQAPAPPRLIEGGILTEASKSGWFACEIRPHSENCLTAALFGSVA
jgi:transposase